MIVVRSTDLGGLQPQALRPLFGLGDDELIVVIRVEDGPPVPHDGPVDPEIPVASPAISLRVETPAQSVAPQPETRGFSFGQLADQAKEQRMELLYQSGVYTLQSPLGQRHYADLQQVASALRMRRFN